MSEVDNRMNDADEVCDVLRYLMASDSQMEVYIYDLVFADERKVYEAKRTVEGLIRREMARRVENGL